LRAVIRRVSSDKGSASSLLFHMELALDRWFFERVWVACRSMPTTDSRIACRLLGAYADVSNILWARRLRETFQLSPANVAAHLIPYGFHLTDRQRRALGSSPADRPLPFPFSGMSPETADLRVRLLRLLRREASRPLFLVPFQVGLPLAYLLLTEMEASDLITLYEGKRWSVPPQTLAERMIRFEPEALTKGQ
jgi:V/A-type H+-transporting ATPase subunit C